MTLCRGISSARLSEHSSSPHIPASQQTSFSGSSWIRLDPAWTGFRSDSTQLLFEFETSLMLIRNFCSPGLKLLKFWFETSLVWFQPAWLLIWLASSLVWNVISSLMILFHFLIWSCFICDLTWNLNLFLIHEELFGKRISLSFSPVFMAIIKLTAEQFFVFQPISSLINPIHI